MFIPSRICLIPGFTNVKSKKNISFYWKKDRKFLVSFSSSLEGNVFFFFLVCCIVTECSRQFRFDKKQKRCLKCIHLLTDDDLHD